MKISMKIFTSWVFQINLSPLPRSSCITSIKTCGSEQKQMNQLINRFHHRKAMDKKVDQTPVFCFISLLKVWSYKISLDCSVSLENAVHCSQRMICEKTNLFQCVQYSSLPSHFSKFSQMFLTKQIGLFCSDSLSS